MSNLFGKNLQVQIFGESHGPAIGCVIDGLPPGFHIDQEALQRFLDRRAPGNSPLATQRKEPDRPEFLSGLDENGTITGATLCAIIRNQDQRSKDYSQIRDCPRPGHADFTADLRYNGFNDIRGGGLFSGRLTAPLCIAGGIALQILAKKNIHVCSRIFSVGDIQDGPLDPLSPPDNLQELLDANALPTLDPHIATQMADAILAARNAQDALGGSVECVATNFPAGIGNPRYDGLKNRLAQVLFGIPATVGLEFGDGFAASRCRASENNDAFEIASDETIRTKTNHSGGILGGISTGMPIVLRVAFKPTPSIAREQDTISFSRLENAKLTVTGRHDPCIVTRAVPVVSAAVALVLLDFLTT